METKNKYGLVPFQDDYECFKDTDVLLNTTDGNLVGHLKNITSSNYILSPFSDTRVNDSGAFEFFLNEKELYYKKAHVRGIRKTTRKSIENFIDTNNNKKLEKNSR